jgi:hypothetical protein
MAIELRGIYLQLEFGSRITPGVEIPSNFPMAENPFLTVYPDVPDG